MTTEREIAVLDFETGGTDPKIHAICSVAVITLAPDWRETHRYYTLIRDVPERLIEDQALDINHLTRAEIAAEGRPIEQVLDEIYALVDGRIVAAHNAAFDVGHLNARGFDIVEAIDTMCLSWKVWPGQSAKLQEVARRFGVTPSIAHHALGDVETTIAVLQKFDALPLDPPARVPQRIDFEWHMKPRWSRR
jgi:DNA polymerase-3 subunit epsilon